MSGPKANGIIAEVPDVVVVQPEHAQAAELSDKGGDLLQAVVVHQELGH